MGRHTHTLLFVQTMRHTGKSQRRFMWNPAFRGAAYGLPFPKPYRDASSYNQCHEAKDTGGTRSAALLARHMECRFRGDHDNQLLPCGMVYFPQWAVTWTVMEIPGLLGGASAWDCIPKKATKPPQRPLVAGGGGFCDRGRPQ